MGQRPAEGPRVLRVHSFLTCIAVVVWWALHSFIHPASILLYTGLY